MARRPIKAMVASRPFTYGTRRLRAGDTFEASETDAVVLQAVGHARYGTRTGAATPKPRRRRQPDAPAPVTAAQIDTPPPGDAGAPGAADPAADLRARYFELTGKKPHPFWREARIAEEIAKIEAGDAGDTDTGTSSPIEKD